MPVQLISEHPDIDSAAVKSCLRTGELLLDACSTLDHQFSILLTNDDSVRKLNRDYRHIDMPTNVLSFPFAIDEQAFRDLIGNLELGDVVISVDRAAAEARDGHCTLQQRLNWLIVHGFLHLLGYDHEASEEDAELMLRKEQELLAELAAGEDGG
jgi:rRNA maturation RNase YbeY